MAVRTITAPPGGGKTLNMVVLARQDAKDYNRFRKIFKSNIYSNFPIVIKESKKPFKYETGAGNIVNAEKEELKNNFIKKILKIKPKIRYVAFSNRIRFTDMQLSWYFCDGASFYIDELSFMYDSMDYKDFPDCIAHFFQIHRHLSYNMIYTNSQSLSRIIKRVLCISEEFWNILDLWKLPLINITKFKITTELKNSRENENNVDINYNEEAYNKIFFKKNAYLAYETKYLQKLNENLPIYNMGVYNNKKMTKTEILENFLISKKERDYLKGMEF